MALATYSDLKTAVANWLHRSDLSTQIVDFIALAESQIRQDVRCRAMEQSATGSLSSATVALPTRFAEARRVLINDEPCRYVTPEEFQPRRLWQTRLYTIEGQNFRFQQSSGTYQIDHWQWFAPFSGNSDTNWLLTNHPDIYLCASLAEAAIYLRDDPAQWATKYQAAIAKLKRAEANVTGPLVVRPEKVE